jgi:hypothetical protein
MTNMRLTNEIYEWGMLNQRCIRIFVIRHSCHFIPLFVIPEFVILFFLLHSHFPWLFGYFLP